MFRTLKLKIYNLYTFLNPNYNLEHQYSSPSTAQTDKNTSSSSPRTSQSAVNSEAVFYYEKYDYPGRYKNDEQGKPFARYR